ncbi:MAG TPA: hypothetical protein VEV83_17610 [Parafilimonas sp.]|nr:hypothetical protein [Parafilimonas sp.]
METLFEAIHVAMPVFHVLMVISLILKIVLMTGFRHFDLPYFVISYFRFYSETERQMGGNAARRRYVILNNYINIYTYVWIFLCIINILFFGTLL